MIEKIVDVLFKIIISIFIIAMIIIIIMDIIFRYKMTKYDECIELNDKTYCTIKE